MGYSYYLLNKPAGCVTACSDRKHPTVMRYMPVTEGLHPIGRLDIDTHGLLLFTTDGKATIALTDPKAHVEKEYLFYAFGELTEEKLDRLKSGVRIGKYLSRPAEARVEDTFTVADMQGLMPEDKRAHYMKNPHGKALCGTITIAEGRKHQVKLMLAAVGCKILYLKRTAIGSIRLDDSLAEGKFRELNDDEIRFIIERKRIYADITSEQIKQRSEKIYEGEYYDKYCDCLTPEA